MLICDTFTLIGIRGYDKLTLNVETDGSLTPEDAIAYAARILQDQLQARVVDTGPVGEPTEHGVLLVQVLEHVLLQVRATQHGENVQQCRQARACAVRGGVRPVMLVLSEQEFQTQEGPDTLIERLFKDDCFQSWAHAVPVGAKVDLV